MADLGSMEKGVLYIATGSEYVREATESARSLLRYNTLSVTLVSDRNYNSGVFDNTIVLSSPRFDQGDSIPLFQHVLYDKTLVLDVDTYICDNIEEVFSPLEYFDLGCAMNIGLGVKYSEIDKVGGEGFKGVPDSFYEYNTGVLLLKRNKRVRGLLEKWRALYNKQKSLARNQPSFRYALYDSDIRFFTLPRRYNYRLPKLAEVDGPIKIIHGRHPSSFEEVERCINKSHDIRVITRTEWPMGVIRSSDLSWEWRLRYNVGRDGVVEVMRRGLSKVIAGIRSLVSGKRNMSSPERESEG